MARLRLNSPAGQVVLVGAICFCGPGMFSALSGMGGGGQVDSAAADAALTALYATFAVFGVIGGGIHNLIGPKITVLFGSIFYILYAGSFLNYNHTKNEGFVVASGGLLGLGAGLLWAGQGAIMMSYPPDGSRGMYISLFWSIFNLGGVLGGFIPFVLNYNTTRESVGDATYIAFMLIMSLGTLLSLGLLPPTDVIRDNGSVVSAQKYSNVWIEGWEILKLFSNWKMLLFAPACIASNFFYTYQFNNVNGLLFNVRTRGLNNVFYWAAQMLGSVFAGRILDHSSMKRRSRGRNGLMIVGGMSMLVWAAGFANQLHYSRNHLPTKTVDFKEQGYLWLLLLYTSFGLLDAMYQTLCYWLIGEMSEDAQEVSRFSGFYKGLQSGGAAIAWQLDAQKVSLMTQLLTNWVLTAISIPLLWIIVKGSFRGELAEEHGLLNADVASTRTSLRGKS